MKKMNVLKAAGLALLTAVTVLSGCNQITNVEPVSVPVVQEEIPAGVPAMKITLDETGIISKTVYNDGMNDHIKVNETSAGKYVVSIDLRPAGKTKYTSAMFSIYNQGGYSGYMLNIADSSTCNGGGGDGRTQTHDSEVDIQNNVMRIYQSDLGNGAKVQLPSDGDSDAYARYNFFYNGERKRMRIDNNRVSWWAGYGMEETAETVLHRNIFALDGQDDPEGPENYKIYAGINRTVGASYRSGTGITTVYVYVEGEVPSAYQNGMGVRVLGWYDAPDPNNPSNTIKRAAVEKYDRNTPAPSGYSWKYIAETAPVPNPFHTYALIKDNDPYMNKWLVMLRADSRMLPIIRVVYR